MRMLSAAAIAIAVVAALASPVLAQPGASPVVTSEVTSEAPRKEPMVAVLLSVGVTAGSFVLLGAGPARWIGVAGLVAGPSTGHWYAGDLGGIGMIARAAAGALILKGVIASDGDGCESWYGDDECAAVEADERRASRTIKAGVALWVGATIYDVVTSYLGVRRWNREHAMQVAPVALGLRATGVAVSLRF